MPPKIFENPLFLVEFPPLICPFDELATLYYWPIIKELTAKSWGIYELAKLSAPFPGC